MRIKKIQLAGLVVAVFGVAGNASAEDVTITTATTTPLSTSDPVAGGAVEAGDIAVNSGGSITVTAGQTAITVDSSNDVTTSSGGALNATDANNVTGILLQGGNSGAITHGGSISLLETYVLADADADGDLDGAFATGTNRHGIHLQAGPTFTGNITSTGSFNVEGNNSSGITLDALLTGNLTTSGNFSIVGDNSVGVAINGGATEGVTGDVIMRGGMTVRGENSSGLVVNGEIDGALIVNGTWSVSGFHNLNRPADISDLDPDDLLIGGPAIAVHYTVADGIHIEGIGVEDDEDDDGDGETEAEGDTNDDVSASITSIGSGPALLIEADPSANMVVGSMIETAAFGLHVQGGVNSSGVYDGVDATAIRIQGAGGATVSILDGIALDGNVTASAQNADASAVVIGVDATVSELLNRRNVTSAVLSDLSQTSSAIVLEAGASVPTINNSGTIRAQLFGETGNAVAITDASGSLDTITNSGSIIAEIFQTDSDATDDVPPPAITGNAIAIDLSLNNSGVTVSQIADVPFNDEDAVDNDSSVRPATVISGDILFGAGVDTIDLLAGLIQGDVSFGAGADVFNIDNGAIYVGRIDDSDGALTINVLDGALIHTGGELNLTTATFGGDGVLRVLLSEVPADSSFLHASGGVTFDAGAQIIPIVPEGLPVSGTHLFLTADGGLVGAGNVTGVVSGVGSPFLYNLTIDTVLGDPNSLEASYILKTTGELGLNTNQSVAFDPIIAALRLDDAAAAAMASIDNQTDFGNAYANLMPSYASASTELAATAIQQMQSATSNRMAHTRLQGLGDVSAWVQEIAYAVNREPIDVNAQEFRGHGFGLAMGVDGPLDNGALFGLSGSFLATEAEEPVRPEGEVSSWFAQGNAYLGTALGPIDLDFVGGLGFGKLRERRFVEIGPSFSAQTEAEWWAYEGHGALRASAPLRLSSAFVITPQLAVTYVGLSEEGYTEEGGGAAIDLEADDVFSERLWGDAGVEFSARWNLRGRGMIAPRLYAGYRSNLIDEEAERTFRFVSGGDEFTLMDASLGEGGPLVGLGIDATNGYSTLSLAYEGEYGDQIERHSVNAAIRFRF